MDAVPAPGVKLKRRQRMIALRIRLSSEQNHRCCYCGVRTNEATHPDHMATLEHVIPHSQGGGNAYANCVMACSRCNNERAHHFSPEHFEVFGLNGGSQ